MIRVLWAILLLASSQSALSETLEFTCKQEFYYSDEPNKVYKNVYTYLVEKDSDAGEFRSTNRTFENGKLYKESERSGTLRVTWLPERLVLEGPLGTAQIDAQIDRNTLMRELVLKTTKSTVEKVEPCTFRVKEATKF